MVKYFAGRISKESERLTELVHRLIDLQKAQARAVLNAERLSVLRGHARLIVENQVKAESKHINLVLSLNGKQKLVHVEGAVNAVDEDDLFINADHETIKTAVKNLVENAVNYSPEHTTVAVGVGSSDGKVSIRVVDQGIGIPESSLDRIFERFYRVDPARSRETGGTGLGLAITKHCVQDCGVRLRYGLARGEGSTFTITLPQAQAVETAETAETAGNVQTAEADRMEVTGETERIETAQSERSE